MFLITGAGRSGTKYMAAVLRRCGLDVGHERLGRDGIVSGFYCFEADRYPGKSHPVPRPTFDVILHQVRHPLKNIASIQTGRSWRWTCRFLPVGVGAPLLTRCCYNWLVFNAEAERQAAFTYRIEALESAWSDLQRALGFTTPYAQIADVPRNVNARKHGTVTWDDVRREAPELMTGIRATAGRYGYELGDE